MIPVKRLTIGTQYWFVCCGIKVFGRYKGREKHVINISDAFVYFTKSKGDCFCIEQYFMLDSRALVDIKIDDSQPDNDFSEHYKNEVF